MLIWLLKTPLSTGSFSQPFSRLLSSTATMANSKFEYVRQFELPDRCLPNTWIVVRVDGKGFHRFSDKHHFQKPNDASALNLMTAAGQHVMNEFRDIVIAYGHSDEYSFVFKKNTESYNRRGSKLMTNLVSMFASSYVFHWPQHMGERQLLYPPAFDARVVLYPNDKNLRDYLSWRQVDCHINNLYNTCFWALVQQGGKTTKEADEALKGTFSSDKHELLFSQFNINYNDEPEQFKKGTVLVRHKVKETITREVPNDDGEGSEEKKYTKCVNKVVPLHTDIIGQKFWVEHPDIVTDERG